MRIYGNRQLKTLPGDSTRPTTARVREALFNIWQGKISHCRWLDLCAGNGSMGAEALCRGAKIVIAIDSNPRACKIIQENWQHLAKADQKYQVWRCELKQRLESLAGQQFDRIYFDPPYESDLYTPVLNTIATHQILAPEGEMAVEHNPKIWHPQEILNLAICRQKVYGNTALTFYRTDYAVS